MNQSYTNIKNGVYEGYPIGVILSFVYKTYSAAPYFTRVDFGPTITSGITTARLTRLPSLPTT